MMKRMILFLMVVLLTAPLAAWAAWAGQIFAVDGGVRGVFSFDATTGTLGTFIPGDPNTYVYGIYGEACLPDGRFLVTDQGRDLVQAYDGTNGQFLSTLITADPGSIPTGIAVTPSGNFLVGMEGMGKIVEYRPDGSEVGIFSAHSGLAPGPFSMAYGPNGNLFVAVGHGSVGSVVELNRDTGEYVREFPVADGPRGLTFGPDGHLFVASVYRQIVEEYDLTSDPVSLVRTFSVLGQGPHGVLVGPDGVLYVGLAPNLARFRLSDGARLDDFAGAQGGSLRELLWSNGSGPCASALLQNPSNGHWHQRFDTPTSWHDARGFCDAKGGYSATITSQTEQDFVYDNLVAGAPYRVTWLGATDEAVEGTWEWVTPEPFSYANWGGGEPNNCGGENYLQIFNGVDPFSRVAQWNDSASAPGGGCICGDCVPGSGLEPSSYVCEWGGFCTKVPAGTISWWTGDLTAKDAIGANNGTIVGGVTYAHGKVGPAFSFSSAGDMVTIPHDASLNIESLTSASFEGWFKSNGGSDFGDALIIGKHTCGFPNGWFFTTDQGCSIGNIAVGGYGVGNLNLDDGQFHHFACVKDGTLYREYIDGVLIGESIGPITGTPNVEPVTIGSIISGNGVCVGSTHQLFGVADEFAVYNRALTVDEVRAIYLTGAAGKCKPVPAQCAQVPSGLVSWWPAESNGVDLTGLNPGTLTGATTFGGGMVGQAFAFPATFDGVLIPNSPSLQLQSLTIDAWVKRDRIDVAGPGPSCNEGEIFVYGFGGYGLGVCGDGSLFLTQVGIDNVNSGPVVTDTAWHHVATTKAADGTVLFYVDGVPTGPYSYNPTFFFNTPTAIGNRGDSIADPASGNPPANFFGLIDEIQVFNRPLSAEEVKSVYSAGQTGKCRQLPVTIDIRPGGFPNSINPFSNGVIPVAILTTGTFNAAIVDAQTVRFGPTGAPPASFLLQDVDLDGDIDLVLQFRTQETGIVCATTSATLTGTTIHGVAISGTDSVRTVNCR